jgi:hypothetical protein
MKNFSIKMRNTVKTVAVLAAVMMIACGGGSESRSGVDKEAQAIVNDVVNWPDNEYTKQLSRPAIDIKVAGIAEMGGSKMFSLTFADGTTKAQIIACVEKVKADGFTREASESGSGGGEYFMYSATNSAGYGVLVSWTEKPPD